MRLDPRRGSEQYHPTNSANGVLVGTLQVRLLSTAVLASSRSDTARMRLGDFLPAREIQSQWNAFDGEVATMPAESFSGVACLVFGRSSLAATPG